MRSFSVHVAVTAKLSHDTGQTEELKVCMEPNRSVKQKDGKQKNPEKQ